MHPDAVVHLLLGLGGDVKHAGVHEIVLFLTGGLSPKLNFPDNDSSCFPLADDDTSVVVVLNDILDDVDVDDCNVFFLHYRR